MSHSTPPRTIRAVFIDIDGTLIRPDKSISPGVREAVAAARRRGCEIVLCTGRTRFTAEPIGVELGIPPGFLVASNGAVVMDLRGGEILHRTLLPAATALRAINVMAALGVTPYAFEDGTAPGVEAARVLFPAHCPAGDFALPPRYIATPSLCDTMPFDPVNVGIFGPPEQIRPLRETIRQRITAEIAIIESGTEMDWGLEVFAGGVSKRAGMEIAAARLGLRRAEIMAIGDHSNDLEMLDWAGVGVAMGNALPEVQAAADWVTTSNEEDGVARAIHRFVLAPAC